MVFEHDRSVCDGIGFRSEETAWGVVRCLFWRRRRCGFGRLGMVGAMETRFDGEGILL
jgi:hypothetical protein